MAAKLSHLDAGGKARMVDVGGKPVTDRRAVAEAFVRMDAPTLRLVRAGGGRKGDVLATARIAGIQGAKRTADLVPLCHPVVLVDVDVDPVPVKGGVRLRSAARALARPGVEMEAMTGAAVAALTVYDMVKGSDRSARIESVRLREKSGGRSGKWRGR